MGDRVALAEDPVDLPRLPVDDARQDRFRLAALGPREASRRLDTNVFAVPATATFAGY